MLNRSAGWFRSVGAVGLAALVVGSMLVGSMAGTAAAAPPELKDVAVLNTEDIDGDGRVSSFQVRVQANTDFPEPGGIGKGNPQIVADLIFAGGGSVRVIGENVARKDGEFIFQVDSGDIYDGNTILLDAEVTALEVALIDSDTGPGILGADIAQDTLTYVWTDPLKPEPASEDQRREITFTSNVQNAQVVVGGEIRGRTPWTGQFAVDHGRQYGKTSVEFRKSGYRTASLNTKLTSDEVHLDMQKQRKPIMVTASPGDATVYVDDQQVGTTPWAGQYWVESSHTVRVEKSGYFAQEVTDVTPKANIHTELVPIGSIQYDPGLLNVTTPNTTTQSGDDSTGADGNDTQVVDFQTTGSSSLATGTQSFDFDAYLPTVIDSVSIIDSIVTANISTSPTDPDSGQAVTFDGSGSYSLIDSIDTYSWSFGNGETARGETVTHTFSQPGTYTVELAVETVNGSQATTTTQVTVADRAPTAAFVTAAGPPVTGTPLSLNASPSSDPDGTIASYEWEIDGDTTQTGMTTTHTFETTGDHEIVLRVTDSAGNTDTQRRTVRVLEPNDEPTASFELSAAEPTAGSELTFDAAGSSDSDGSIEGYSWDFGDGNVATGQQPTHAFNDSGTYTVNLAVVDDRGDIHTVSERIEVGGGAAADGADTTGSDAEETTDSVPGFGAVAAVVSLLAVVVLLGRRE